MSRPISPGAVVIDVNILLAICTKEHKEQTARTAIADYATKNWRFYAPGVISGEFLFIPCRSFITAYSPKPLTIKRLRISEPAQEA